MSACPNRAPPPLSRAEAFEVLEPPFEVVRAVFARELPKAARVELEVASWVHDSPRHYAATEDTGKVIVVAPVLAELPEETVLAILAHEFGHAADFLYPGEYLMLEDGSDELVRLRSVDEAPDGHPVPVGAARERLWRARSTDVVEATADRIAEEVTGKLIGYAGPCELQSFARGRRPRRKGLR